MRYAFCIGSTGKLAFAKYAYSAQHYAATVPSSCSNAKRRNEIQQVAHFALH